MAVLALVSTDCTSALDLVAVWLKASSPVEVILLDAAAATSRLGHAGAEALEGVLAAGAVVAAHDEALRRRGIAGANMVAGVKTISLDEVADRIGDTTARVVWL